MVSEAKLFLRMRGGVISALSLAREWLTVWGEVRGDFFAHGYIVILALFLLPNCASYRCNESLQSSVSGLIDKTVGSGKAARKAFGELESLGNQVAPYFVGHLGDMRPLAARGISLQNRAPDAFEGVRHYGPEVVHDALAAILSQMTGESFVFVYNGATAQERQENRDRWVEWCLARYPDKGAICNGE